MKKYRIAVIPGDGVCKYVMPEGMPVLGRWCYLPKLPPMHSLWRREGRAEQ